MSAGKVLSARFPGKYLQGPGAINLLGEESKKLGAKPLCLIDVGIEGLLKPTVRSAFDQDQAVNFVTHGGDCTEAEISSVASVATTANCDAIVGVGGGKALDTAKAVAHNLNLPCVIIPTIAASDAPCSALAIIYNQDGSLDRALHLTRNPDIVIVDSEIIAAAPARFLAAGIADGLATCLEASACRASGAKNTFGYHGNELAYAIARLCEETMFEFGEQAIAECASNQVGEATERVIEANILLSGLGFESCGVAAAHGIQDGLCELEETHSSLHGEKVAIGILGELLLNDAGEEKIQKFRSFMKNIGLPTTLPEIGIADITDDQLQRVAVRSCRPGDIIHNEPMPITPDMVASVLRKVA